MGESSFFGKKKSGGERIAVSSNLGSPATSIALAEKMLFHAGERIDPRRFIEHAAKKEKNYYGTFHFGENRGKPFFLDDEKTTMEIYVGSTGTGKGVLLGNRAVETIKKGKGLIVIDPKGDEFLPQICKAELEAQGRPDDFQVVAWNQNFGYDGINEFDSYNDIANKLIDAFGLEESDNPGVDYYRRNARVMLKKVLKIFFDGSLGVIVKKDLKEILTHIIRLKEDIEKQELLDKENSRNNPSYDKIRKLSLRFFDQKKIEEIYWDSTTVETLDSLSKSFAELLEAGNIFKRYDLRGALYEGKVIYFKVDMLDISSLKMIKLMINDAIQQARTKRADAIIIADELSFYANQTIAGALATVRSMGLKFILALQDLAQMKDEHIRNAILSNCNFKLFYKISDKMTLEYVEKIGGRDLVTKYSKSIEKGETYAQDLEDYMNTTKIRALPRAGVAIAIAEALPHPVIIKTDFVPVEERFDWSKHSTPPERKRKRLSEIEGEAVVRKREERFEVKIKDKKRLLENSDLWAIEYESIEL